MAKERGRFTIPGEAGYEELTLRLSGKWGADVVRDSDGTELSPEILEAGMDVYSTICIIRGHNGWAKENRDKLQQTFLSTEPETASGETLSVSLLDGFFREQFAVNDTPEAFSYWQVYDRTTGSEIPKDQWSWDPKEECVEIRTVPWHRYSVSFLAYRVWEEISMYNHVTNSWQKEHLMPVEPFYPETRAYLLDWMDRWCREHPATNVVRFTSLFYNFVWIWGSDPERRNLFTDWASYDFTVSDAALAAFEKQFGYRMTAEDFINQGKLHVTHQPATSKKKDWMRFIHAFCLELGRELIETVHRYGKKAYVFYDDSWVGLEPYAADFEQFGFDGIIKCVFSGFEVRLCSGVKTETHEIRLHPYLFPVGLGGLPTFMEGGNPALDAKKYWVSVRRALLRAPIERMGLGGYLHLVEGFPDFVDYIEKISDEFREICKMHASGKPFCAPVKIAVLHYWGGLRSWTLSGHFHETWQHNLIHVNEALSGLPFETDFLSFEDIKSKDLSEYNVILNAGNQGDAWSGGDAWRDPKILEKLTEWVYQGGTFLGIGEPSAVSGADTCFRMAHVLGVDLDRGERICHGKWQVRPAECPYPAADRADLKNKEGLYLTDKNTKVYLEKEGSPLLTEHPFGKGRGVYLSSFNVTPIHTRLLAELLTGEHPFEELPFVTDTEEAECTCFPDSGKTVVINNSGRELLVSWKDLHGERQEERLLPYETRIRRDS
ncbi:MAG: 1,3-beta-galactosyl-N-acetylhexosamine phosphorylase [Candidatus Limivivens sp.]|nr:1,3-beta-galactosyl-N-acetylhexosamine phosphorylase [Candidatus Limivivens sp.]